MKLRQLERAEIAQQTTASPDVRVRPSKFRVCDVVVPDTDELRLR
jgi:hypothetical protein